MKAKTSIALFSLILALLSMAVSFAQPSGPGQINVNNNERRTNGIDNATGGTQVQAQAGNVTALRINSTRLTSRWQGYYGNVTGTVTLDDANNMTLFSWDLASPKGEIYASNGSSVSWGNIFCFNYSNNLSAGSGIVQKFNGTDLERSIGASSGDRDSVNGTFNSTYTGTFNTGTVSIDSSDACMKVNLFVNDQYQTTQFTEVLLSDNNSIIYTSLLEQDAVGFQNAPVDFQMIVGENGDAAGATNYYFFVELS